MESFNSAQPPSNFRLNRASVHFIAQINLDNSRTSGFMSNSNNHKSLNKKRDTCQSPPVSTSAPTQAQAQGPKSSSKRVCIKSLINEKDLLLSNENVTHYPPNTKNANILKPITNSPNIDRDTNSNLNPNPYPHNPTKHQGFAQTIPIRNLTASALARQSTINSHRNLAAYKESYQKKIVNLSHLYDISCSIIQNIWPNHSASKTTQICPLRNFVIETHQQSRLSTQILEIALYYLIQLKPVIQKRAKDSKKQRSADFIPSFGSSSLTSQNTALTPLVNSDITTTANNCTANTTDIINGFQYNPLKLSISNSTNTTANLLQHGCSETTPDIGTPALSSAGSTNSSLSSGQIDISSSGSSSYGTTIEPNTSFDFGCITAASSTSAASAKTISTINTLTSLSAEYSKPTLSRNTSMYNFDIDNNEDVQQQPYPNTKTNLRRSRTCASIKQRGNYSSAPRSEHRQRPTTDNKLHSTITESSNPNPKQEKISSVCILTPRTKSAGQDQDQTHIGNQNENQNPKKPEVDITRCGRRMFVAALMCASKFSLDCAISNKVWHKITSLPNRQITLMEISFLKLINYTLYIDPLIFKQWSLLLQFSTAAYARIVIPDALLPPLTKLKSVLNLISPSVNLSENKPIAITSKGIDKKAVSSASLPTNFNSSSSAVTINKLMHPIDYSAQELCPGTRAATRAGTDIGPNPYSPEIANLLRSYSSHFTSNPANHSHSRSYNSRLQRRSSDRDLDHIRDNHDNQHSAQLPLSTHFLNKLLPQPQPLLQQQRQLCMLQTQQQQQQQQLPTLRQDLTQVQGHISNHSHSHNQLQGQAQVQIPRNIPTEFNFEKSRATVNSKDHRNHAYQLDTSNTITVDSPQNLFRYFNLNAPQHRDITNLE